MARQELKKLRIRIVKEFGLCKIDACECVDLVAWGLITEAQLLARLTADKADN